MTCWAVISSFPQRLSSKLSRYEKNGAARYRVALFLSKVMEVGEAGNSDGKCRYGSRYPFNIQQYGAGSTPS